MANLLALTKADFCQQAGQFSLHLLSGDSVVSAQFLRRYCGWADAAISALPKAGEKAPRFGPFGPSKVVGYWMRDVEKMERTAAFRSLHPNPLSVSESRLKGEYFFTDGLIRKWLGEPDAYIKNPHYRSAPPMRLHRIGKIALLRQVEAVEAALAKVADQRETRSAAARASAQARIEAWIARFDAVQWRDSFARFSGMDAVARATAASQEMGMKTWAQVEVGHQHRWMVNFLRHECTNYDSILALDLPPGRAGRVCYARIKGDILDRIGEVFPTLRVEAHRQKYS